MKKLYELVNDLHFLEDIEPESEEQETRLREMTKTVNLDIEVKALSIAQYVISLKAEASAVKQEEDRLHTRRQAIVNRIEWLKGHLFDEMRAAMIGKVKNEVCTVSIQQSPISIEVVDVHALSEEYQRIIVEPDKKKILEYFKETGVILPGVNIITSKEHLVIR